MFRENLLDKTLYSIKKLVPKSVFKALAPYYHSFLAHTGAIIYGYPSRSMKVIGVTGTKGKSTTVFLTTHILEGAGKKVAAIGSLGFKIKDKTWPNTLKMTMPGRFKLQKFLSEAKKAGCEYVVLEVTSEGISQKRHLGIDFDCAVFTNLHKEHLESHGSFEKYMAAKQELFRKTSNRHVINADDFYAEKFGNFKAKQKIYYGIKAGDMVAKNIQTHASGSFFEVYGTYFNIHFGGEFNILNTLAALSVAAMYEIDLPSAKPVLDKIKEIPGRMQFIQRDPFSVVVDYAHTPDSLRSVYGALKKDTPGRLICILGSAGGGRDTWKRPEFGSIAEQYCDKILLTDEDPFEENPRKIVDEIYAGIQRKDKVEIIMDRKDAIRLAIKEAQPGDAVIITGKGSEISMALAGGKKIPWSDAEIIREALRING
ncbi:MAG TPA: UDP-N-acetylmuramoyl-L-alanyl-D-glutamate--2,6-diaminopimelate ligase [Candidatus Paceibacterota bacterium]